MASRSAARLVKSTLRAYVACVRAYVMRRGGEARGVSVLRLLVVAAWREVASEKVDEACSIRRRACMRALGEHFGALRRAWRAGRMQEARNVRLKASTLLGLVMACIESEVAWRERLRRASGVPLMRRSIVGWSEAVWATQRSRDRTARTGLRLLSRGCGLSAAAGRVTRRRGAQLMMRCFEALSVLVVCLGKGDARVKFRVLEAWRETASLRSRVFWEWTEATMRGGKQRWG